MPVVNLTVVNAADEPQERVKVTAKLVTGPPGVPGYTGADHVIVRRVEVWTDSSGEAELDLPANDDIEPANTYYRVDWRASGEQRFVATIQVPDTAGPFDFPDILYIPPEDLEPGGGGGGAVDSVNGQTGVVVLTAADVGAASAADITAAVAAHNADTTAVHGIADTTDVIVEGDSRLSDSRAPSGSAGGVLGGTYPNPSFAADMATQAELDAHAADTTAIHGIVDTSAIIIEGDSRLTNSRAPNGTAGGVLGGSYPNPSFAADMATQAELDAHAVDTTAIHGITDTSVLETTSGATTKANAAEAAAEAFATAAIETHRTGATHALAQPVTVRKNSSGSGIGTRSRLNLVEGTGITLTIADDAVNGEIDITIDAPRPRVGLQGWVRANLAISLPNTTELLRGTLVPRIPMVKPGSIVGLSVGLDAARTAGSVTVEATKNGTGVGLTCVIDGTNTQYNHTNQDPGLDTFVEGDNIGATVATDAALLAANARDVDVTVWVVYDS